MTDKRYGAHNRSKNHPCGDICTCHGSQKNGIVTLFAARDGDVRYELKFYVSRSELVLVISNVCNPECCETVVLTCQNRCLQPVLPPEIPVEIPCRPPPIIKCIKGDKGDKGDNTGERGERGERGSVGPRGEIGPKR